MLGKNGQTGVLSRSVDRKGKGGADEETQCEQGTALLRGPERHVTATLESIVVVAKFRREQ